MNIIDYTSYSYGLKYYGLQDLSIGWEVKFLIENKQKIQDYFSNEFENQINNLDNYIDYLWVSKFIEINEAIPLLKKDEDRPKLKSIHAFLYEIFNRYNIGMLVKYLAKNYRQVFESNHDNHYYHDMKSSTIDFVFAYSKSFTDEVFDYIENNYWYLIIDNFELYSDFYKKHLTRFQKNIINDNIAIEKITNYDRVFKILEICKKEPYEQFAKTVAKSVSIHVLKMAESINEDNYIEILSYIEKAKKIAILYKLPEAYSYETLNTQLEKVSNSYFEKHGHKFETEPIDLKKAVQDLKENKNPPIIKYLEFTHVYKKESREFVPIFDQIMTGNKAIFDHISHIGIPEDEYFTPSRITDLGMYFDIFSNYLFVCFKDENMLDSIFSNYHRILSDLANEGILSEEDLEEFLGMCSVFSSILNIESKGHIKKSLSYGLSMLVVAYIEKLLRKYFMHINSRDTYINVKKYTLNMLLNEKGIQDVFGEHVSKVLEYQLTKKRTTDIGLNYRNNLMHNSDINFSEMNIGYPVRMFYCLIILLNVIGTNYITINDK